VHIGTNPEATVRFVERSTRTSAEKKQRAATARRLLTTLGTNIGASKWADLVDRNKDVDTVLDPLGTACIADLVQHAYVLSAVQCHVFLGYPLPPEREWESLFGRARFDAIARGNVLTCGGDSRRRVLVAVPPASSTTVGPKSSWARTHRIPLYFQSVVDLYPQPIHAFSAICCGYAR
jgi:hypothetical protein